MQPLTYNSISVESLKVFHDAHEPVVLELSRFRKDCLAVYSGVAIESSWTRRRPKPCTIEASGSASSEAAPRRWNWQPWIRSG